MICMQVAIEIILLSEKYKKFLGISWDSNPRPEFDLNTSQVLLPLDHLDTCRRIAIGRQATDTYPVSAVPIRVYTKTVPRL